MFQTSGSVERRGDLFPTGNLIELVFAGFFILTNPSSCDGYREAPTNPTSEVNGTYC